MLLKFFGKKFNYIRTYRINFGPQHPAAHGVLRLIIELNGEVVIGSDAHIGFLHRGTEKLLEFKTVLQGIPYFDRLDYVSMMTQEHAFVLNIEKLCKILIPQRAQWIRIIFSELTRILNHLMAITTHALDVGAITPFLWGFEEREKIMEFYERVCGARMHAAYFRVGGLAQELPLGLVNDIYYFCLQFNARLSEIEELLTFNRVWKSRLSGIGCVSCFEAVNRGFTGTMLRATGINWDLRKAHPYELYNYLDFYIPIGCRGDSYNRYQLRMEEMRQSLNIIFQCLNNLPTGGIKLLNNNCVLSKGIFKSTMEATITHFKFNICNLTLNSNESYLSIEAPKGEFATYLVINNFNRVYRCKIRSPAFFHLQGLDYLAYNHFLSDVTTLIGTIDIVFGEIDR